MKRANLLGPGAVLLVAIGCSEAPNLLAPTPPTTLQQAAAQSSHLTGPVAVAGDYDAVVDFSTLTLTPRGSNCLLQVDGQLVFSGTIEGVATGTTTALVLATCEEAASTPPGTHRDVFRSELEFEGTIAGVPAQGDMMYQGRVQEGGEVEGRIIASGGIAGVLEVDAQVAVGGSYAGSLVVH